MEITIKGDAKELAALVSELQERPRKFRYVTILKNLPSDLEKKSDNPELQDKV